MHVHEMQYGHDGGFLPGLYYPHFTSHESFTDTYIISVNGTENLTITINSDNTTKSVELYSVGPVDNTSTALQGSCNADPGLEPGICAC